MTIGVKINIVLMPNYFLKIIEMNRHRSISCFEYLNIIFLELERNYDKIHLSILIKNIKKVKVLKM